MDKIKHPTISNAIKSYLKSKEKARTKRTAQIYKFALDHYLNTLRDIGINPDKDTTEKLNVDTVDSFLESINGLSASTERLYLTAVINFLKYLQAKKKGEINIAELEWLVKEQARKQPERLPPHPKEEVKHFIEWALKLNEISTNTDNEKLRNLRDRALIVTLADTGLRIHEACKIIRGDVDWNTGQITLIGKGNKQAVVRCSERSLKTLKEYHAARAVNDSQTGIMLFELPVFARHDKGAGKITKPMTPTTGRDIFEQRLKECFEQSPGRITPHTMRHWFVSEIVKKKNIRVAQILARHSNITITEKYADYTDKELNDAYSDVFEES